MQNFYRSSLAVVALLCSCGERDTLFEAPLAAELVQDACQRFEGLERQRARALQVKAAPGGFRPATSARPDLLTRGPWRAPGPHRIDAELPARAGGVTRLTSGPVTLESRPLGARDVPGVATDRALVYRDAYPGADSLVLAEAERVEEFIILRDSRAPRRFEYALTVTRGGGRVRQNGPAVEVLDQRGNAWLRLARPYAVDARGERVAVTARLDQGRLVLRVEAGQAWAYPLLLDPGWLTTGSMASARAWSSAARLKSGKVLVSGGYTKQYGLMQFPLPELFDPQTETWTTTGKTVQNRCKHVSALLSTGKVLAVGGNCGSSTTAELYDPASGAWAATGNLKYARVAGTRMVLLTSGKALVVRGAIPETYDPATGAWAPTSPMGGTLNDTTTTLLASGKVLVIESSSVVIYDPKSDTWTKQQVPAMPRKNHAAVLLTSGKVLVAGGCNGQSCPLAHLYDPVADTWAASGNLNNNHSASQAVRLDNGQVLIYGGACKNETYNPGTGKWSAAGCMPGGTAHDGSLTLLDSGLVLATGGGRNNTPASWAALYDPTSGAKCASAKTCATGHCVDGVCCESACDATCKVCAATTKTTGFIGACTLVAAGKQDLSAKTPCSGTQACDGKGNCLKGQGQACAKAAECASGHCVDGRCCDTACAERCKACDLGGKVGTCSFLAQGTQDASAKIACTGSSVCDGQGGCKLKHGYKCSSGAACASGHCVDGTCCTSACAATCKACDVAGSPGVCANILAGLPDTHAAIQCSGAGACDGAGACKKASGQACAKAADCGNGRCVDGYCCATACTGTCKGCGVSGKRGSCANLPRFQDDLTAAVTCDGARTCDGAGACKQKKGQFCAANSSCASGICVENRCCDTACMETCRSCAVAGKPGQCAPVPAGQPDLVGKTFCVGAQACDGAGGCRKATGQKCALNTECATGYCVDGVCCDQKCLETCKTCALPGKEGTCAHVPAGKADTYALKICFGKESCDGLGGCKKGLGVGCTTGSQCGSGHCVDGYCCATACTAPCRSCGIPGSIGSCATIAAGKADTFPANTCAGKKACDGKGACKKSPGLVCVTGVECFSGHCADGYCCDKACLGACETCAAAASAGTCVKVAAGKPDKVATKPCTGQQACDGLGVCKKNNGQPCATAGECGSGYCMDFVCCDTACTGLCRSCALVGSAGKCTGLAKGQPDPSGLVPCAGAMSCDGAGGCKKVDGQPCKKGAECASGHCMDGVCCHSGCTGTCRSCAVPGSKGTCAAVPAGAADTVATMPCHNGHACDGQGACLLGNGKLCSKGSQCGSGYCVDGVCCDGACTAACYACDVTGKAGTCSPVAAGQPDALASTTCMGQQACDGKGGCKKGSGQACAKAADCGSGHCVDKVCCEGPCTATCRACDVAGKSGTCAFVATGKSDAYGAQTCTGSKSCDGNGNCLLATGEACNKGKECASDHCADDRCCDKACSRACQSCALPGSVGTCTPIPANSDPDNDCIGKDKLCGGLCDGKGACEFPGLGTACGTCRACDGTGQCSAAPKDDDRCGVIDCDKLDTKCRDYQDLVAARCGSFGQCKAANEAANCTLYSPLCGAADAGPAADSGPAPEERDAGCSCRAGAGGSGPTGAAALLLVLLALRRRRGRC